MAPTSTTDRVCMAVTECRQNEIEIVPTSVSINRQCSVCGAGAVVSNNTCKPCVNGTYDDDSYSGTSCAICGAGYSVADNRTACVLVDPCVTTENSCATVAICTNTGPGLHSCECGSGFWGDGQWCSPWAECTLDVSYQRVAPTSASDRVCVPVTICLGGEFEVQEPTCNFTSTYMESRNESDNDSGSWGSRIMSELPCIFPNVITNRRCNKCAAGTYQPFVEQNSCPQCTGAGLYDHDMDPTTRCAVCTPGSIVVHDRTQCVLDNPCADDTRICHVAAFCNHTGPAQHICECETGFWGDGMMCSVWSICVAGITFELTPPNSTSDRVCGTVTECEPGQHESTPPGSDHDRVCDTCQLETYSPAMALECSPCVGLYFDGDEDPATPCAVNLGIVLGIISFSIISVLISMAVVPLYCRRISLATVAPEDIYVPQEKTESRLRKSVHRVESEQ